MSNINDVGFAVLYRWKIRPGYESSFVEAWTRISELLLMHRNSLGSRLHRGSDGLWYSYAQWPSAEARAAAFAAGTVDAVASKKMKNAIAEELPEILIEPLVDCLVMSR